MDMANSFELKIKKCSRLGAEQINCSAPNFTGISIALTPS